MSDSEDELSLRDAGASFFITVVMSLTAVLNMKVDVKIDQHVDERHLNLKMSTQNYYKIYRMPLKIAC